MSQRRTLLTADEFFRHYSHKEGHYELLKGEVIEMAPPGGVHGGIAVNIASELRTFVRQHDLGRVVVETGFRLVSRPDTVRGPDVAFIAKDRLPVEGLPRAFFMGAPDLAVEIVSHSDGAGELEMKVSDYLRNGSSSVWVVYPDGQRVQVFRSDGSGRWYSEDAAIEEQELLPGFRLPLHEIFGP